MGRTPQRDILKRQREELERSQRYRDQNAYEDKWRRMKDLYRGKHYERASKEDRTLINLAFSNINIIVPSVSINYPKFTLNPRTPEDAAGAVFAEEVLNYEWRTNKFQNEFRLAVNDQLQIGHGWMKSGWKNVKEAVADKPAEDDDNPADKEDEDSEVISETTTTRIVEDRPFAERISPFDVYVDPDARTPRELRWIAQRIWRPTNLVRHDKRYNKQARDEASTTSVSKYDDERRRATILSNDETLETSGYIEVIEYYDIERRTMSTFARDGGDTFLVKPREQPYAFGHPFVMFRNHEVVDEFYPMGELEAIEELQYELNETRTQMLNDRKRYKRKHLYRRSAFDKQGLAELESEVENALVPVESNDPLNDVVVPLPQNVVDAQMYDHYGSVKEDIQEISGITEFQRGSTPEVRRTATEASIIQDNINARASDKLARIELTLADVGEQVMKLIQQFMTGKKVARVIGSEAQPVWIEYDKEYIRGDFDFEVEAGSTQPQNESFRRQSAMQIVEAMLPFVDYGVVNVEALAAYVLEFGFGLKNMNGILQSPPPPEEEMMEEDPMGGPPMSPEEEMMMMQQGMPPEGMPAGPPPEGMGMQPEVMPQQGGGILPPEILADAEARGMPPELLEQLVLAKQQGVQQVDPRQLLG